MHDRGADNAATEVNRRVCRTIWFYYECARESEISSRKASPQIFTMTLDAKIEDGNRAGGLTITYTYGYSYSYSHRRRDCTDVLAVGIVVLFMVAIVLVESLDKVY
jgi:hypothetical protein